MIGEDTVLYSYCRTFHILPSELQKMGIDEVKILEDYERRYLKTCI